MYKWILKKLGYRHWYRIKFEYKVDGKIMFHYNGDYGLYNQRDIINHRKMKIIDGTAHSRVPQLRHLLNNGDMFMEVQCYLGFIKKTIK